MDYKLELVVLSVSDVDRAKTFYADQAGFNVDVDHHPNENFRVVQLTPPGSACSITIGVGVTTSTPGCAQGLHLVVTDIEAARGELVDRGVDASDYFHFGPTGQTDGLSPSRGDFETFMSISDPDGNGWLVQEVPSRAGS